MKFNNCHTTYKKNSWRLKRFINELLLSYPDTKNIYTCVFDNTNCAAFIECYLNDEKKLNLCKFNLSHIKFNISSLSTF